MYTTILALCMAVLYFFSFFFLFFPIYIPCTVLYYCSFCRVILLNVSSGFNLSAQVYIIIITYKQFVKKFSSIAFLYFIEKCKKVVFQKNKKLSLRRLTIQYFFFLFFFFLNSILLFYSPPLHTHTSSCHTPTNQRALSPPFTTLHHYQVRCLLAHFDILFAFRPSRCYCQHHGPPAFSTPTP